VDGDLQVGHECLSGQAALIVLPLPGRCTIERWQGVGCGGWARDWHWLKLFESHTDAATLRELKDGLLYAGDMGYMGSRATSGPCFLFWGYPQGWGKISIFFPEGWSQWLKAWCRSPRRFDFALVSALNDQAGRNGQGCLDQRA